MTSHPHLSPKVISALVQPQVGVTLTHVLLHVPPKGFVQSSSELRSHYSDPLQAIRALSLWCHTECFPRDLATHCTLLCRIPTVSAHRLPQLWGTEDLLCPSSLFCPWIGRDISKASCLWLLYLSSLSPRACDMLRVWGHSQTYMGTHPL